MGEFEIKLYCSDCYDDSSSKYNTNGTYINMRCEQPKYKIDSLGKLSILIRTTTDDEHSDDGHSDDGHLDNFKRTWTW